MKSRTCCFTGHRSINKLQYPIIKLRLKKALCQLIDDGYTYFGAGGALGFDTLAAQTVIELRKKYPKIKLILVLPCLTQAERWSEDDKIIYEAIKEAADKIVYTSQDYTKGCMFKRNRHLVDCSSVCVCYQTKDTGGTAYTVHYALQKGIRIINIAKKN